MFSRSILKTLLFATILLAAVATTAAAAPADEATLASIGSIHTYLTPDLSLKSVLSVQLLPKPDTKPDTGFKRGSCHCSCATNNCNKDSDCGPGVTCDEFISCCAKGDAQWFQDAGQSSRKIEAPSFRSSCN